MAVTACNQQNMHPHLHINISSPLYPVPPLTRRENGSKTCVLWCMCPHGTQGLGSAITGLCVAGEPRLCSSTTEDHQWHVITSLV